MARMGSVEIPIEADTKSFEMQIEQVEKELEDLLRIYDKSKKSKFANEEDLQKQQLDIEKLKNKLVGLKAQQDKLNYGNGTKQLAEHDKSLGRIIKKVGKWALAVFGVRSAYQFVRQAASTIGQYDKKIGADIQYIRYALAFTLKPVVEWLIKAAYTILQYVGAIIYRLTGYNIFQNSGVKQFKSSMGSAEKSSKKIKDNLSASFDEFNALSKQDSGSSGAGSEGVGTPSMDLSKLKQIELPKWLTDILDFIKENKDTILKILGVALTLFTLGKVAGWIAPVGNILDLFTGGKLGGALKGFVSSLATGLTIVGSIALTAYSAYKWLEGNKQQRKNINKMTKQGVEYSKEDAKNFKNMDEMQDALNYKRKEANRLLDDTLSTSAYITGTSDKLQKNAIAVVEQQDNYLQQQIKNYKQGKLNKEEQEKLKEILLDQLDYNLKIGDRLDAQGGDSRKIRDYSAQYRDILGEMGVKLDNMPDPFYQMHEEMKKSREEASGFISDIKNKFDKTAIRLKIEADAKSAGVTLKDFATNFAKLISQPMRSMGMGAMADLMIKKVQSIKMASGGIVNNPGRGVPVGMAIAGEAGREGVIPLTDSRAMAELGQEIGKYVNINNMINNYIDSRRLNQLMAKSQNRDDFARNG